MPYQPCSKLGCKNLVKKYSGTSRCPDHQSKSKSTIKSRLYEKARSSEARASGGRVYDLAVWKSIRLQVLGQEPICRACQRSPSTEVDHIDQNKWNLQRDNLQGLCKSCHSRKTLRENR